MKKYIFISLSCLAFYSCFWDEPNHTEHLIKDFTYDYYFDEREMAIYKSDDPKKFGGFVVVPETVFAIGFNDDFIIAKNYPNKEKEISERLFNWDKKTGDYILEDPNDTIYLSTKDKVYEKDEKWYHISNGWNPPDSLYPYRKIVNYYIIDIRNFNEEINRTNEVKYEFNTKSDFQKKKFDLGVPSDLKFTIFNNEFDN